MRGPMVVDIMMIYTMEEELLLREFSMVPLTLRVFMTVFLSRFPN